VAVEVSAVFVRERPLYSWMFAPNRRRALNIFRDETDLSISSELLGSIFRVVDQSSHFLLLASQRAAGSKWVQREIDHWISERGSRSLLVILTDGELVWDDKSHDFDWDRTDALPQCVRGHFAGEPLWVDFRWAKQEQNLTLKNETFRDTVATVAAELHGMSKRDLVGEDLRQHQKFLRVKRIASVTGVVLLAGVLLASYFALQQTQRAKQQATMKLARQLASDSTKVVNDQARLIELSVLLAAESIRRQPLPECDAAIRRALALYPKEIPIRVDGTTRAIVFTPDSQRAAVASDRNEVSIIELPSGKARLKIRTSAAAASLEISTGGYLAVAFEDGTVQLFEVSKGDKIADLKPGGGAIRTMAFSPDGHDLAVSEGNSVHMFETQGWRPLQRIDAAGEVEHIAFSRDSQMLVTGSEGVVAFSKRKDSWTRANVDEVPSKGAAFDRTAISADGLYRVSCGHMASQNKNCRISSVSDSRDFAVLVHPDLVESVEFSPDGLEVATVSRDQVLRVFETATGKPTAYVPGTPANVVFSPDSRYLATQDGEHVRLFQLASESVVRSRPGGRLISAAFSADGRYVAHGGRAEVFDLTTAQPVLPLDRGLKGRTVALSADGHLLAIGDPIRVMEVKSATQEPGRGSGMCMGLAFSSDARYLAVGNMAGVELRDLAGEKLLFERHTRPCALSL